MTPVLRCLRVFSIFCLFAPALIAATAEDDPLASLRAGHPRLLVEPETWSQILVHAQVDPQLAGLIRIITDDARGLLDDPPITHQKVGRRLLSVSRRALQRTLTLATAYRLSNDDRFARRAEREMLAAAAFANWNPSHFLDVGEMTAALAIGSDWLDDVLAPDARATIRRAIVEKGLRPGLDPKAPHNSWQRRQNNWNQVCWGGLALGALAVAEDEPDLARAILSGARANIVYGLEPYAPDGVYPEGPAYWAYGTTYQVVLISALESALGTDWGLTASPGFLGSAGALLQATGPTGLAYNFADGSERTSLDPAMLWFARKTGDPGLLFFHKPMMESFASPSAPQSVGDRFATLALLWWPRDGAGTTPKLPLAWHGRGANPMAAFRAAWSDRDALYLACKGGSASLNHAHMDAGSFVFELDGVRWARDLGAQSYESLESKGVDLWNRKQDSQRWQVFRLNNRSHNTLTIDDQLQRVDGRADFVHFSHAGPTPFAVIDLSEIYATQAEEVRRGFRIESDRSVLIQDELVGLRPGARVRWAMVTGADVSIDGAHATLHEAGRALEVRVLAPDGAKFEQIPAEPPADGFNAPNPGRRILISTTTAPEDGRLRIAVLLTRGAAADATDSRPPVAPLAEWRGNGSP